MPPGAAAAKGAIIQRQPRAWSEQARVGYSPKARRFRAKERGLEQGARDRSCRRLEDTRASRFPFSGLAGGVLTPPRFAQLRSRASSSSSSSSPEGPNVPGTRGIFFC